jgi:hypothetical protein
LWSENIYGWHLNLQNPPMILTDTQWEWEIKPNAINNNVIVCKKQYIFTSKYFRFKKKWKKMKILSEKLFPLWIYNFITFPRILEFWLVGFEQSSTLVLSTKCSSQFFLHNSCNFWPNFCLHTITYATYDATFVYITNSSNLWYNFCLHHSLTQPITQLLFTSLTNATSYYCYPGQGSGQDFQSCHESLAGISIQSRDNWGTEMNLTSGGCRIWLVSLVKTPTSSKIFIKNSCSKTLKLFAGCSKW